MRPVENPNILKLPTRWPNGSSSPSKIPIMAGSLRRQRSMKRSSYGDGKGPTGQRRVAMPWPLRCWPGSRITSIDRIIERQQLGPIELAFISHDDDPGLSAMLQAMREIYLPNRIIAMTHIPDGSSAHPLLSGKKTVNGRAALYLCRNFSCQQPLSDPLQVVEALQVASKPAGQPSGGTRLQGQSIDGSAMVEGTARYAARLVNQPRSYGRFEYGFTPFGATGLTASRLGFGCYRVDASNQEYRTALSQALRSGVNLIDTSTN